MIFLISFSSKFSEAPLQLGLALLLLLHLQQQRAVDAGQDTTEGDGGADEGVQLFITTDGQLQVTRGDTLDLEVLGGVTGQLQNFGSQVLENGGNVDSSWDMLASKEAQIHRGEDEMDGIPLAPTRILFWVLFFRKRLTRPQGN